MIDLLIVSDSPLCGAINLDAVSLFNVEGAMLQFVTKGHRIEINCGDNTATLFSITVIDTLQTWQENSDWTQRKVL